MKLLLRLCQMTLTNKLHMHWIYWKQMTSIKVMSSAVWMKSSLGDLLIHLRITIIWKIINMTCVVKVNWTFHHGEYKNVTKESEFLGPLNGIDWKYVRHSTILKNVLRNSCWNIICLDTMYELFYCSTEWCISNQLTRRPYSLLQCLICTSIYTCL